MKFALLIALLLNSPLVFAQDLVSITESVRVIFPAPSKNLKPSSQRDEFIPDTEAKYSRYQIEERDQPISVRPGDTIEIILTEALGELIVSYPSCAPKDPNANLALYAPPVRVSLIPETSSEEKEVYRFKVSHKVSCPQTIFYVGASGTTDHSETLAFSSRNR